MIFYTCQCLSAFHHPNIQSLPQIFCSLFSLFSELKIQLYSWLPYLTISDICLERTRICQRLRSIKTLFQSSVSNDSTSTWTYRTICGCIKSRISNLCLFRQLFYSFWKTEGPVPNFKIFGKWKW